MNNTVRELNIRFNYDLCNDDYLYIYSVLGKYLLIIIISINNVIFLDHRRQITYEEVSRFVIYTKKITSFYVVAS